MVDIGDGERGSGPAAGSMSKRTVIVAAQGEDATAPDYGVAIVGNGEVQSNRRPKARAFDNGAAIAGDNAIAEASKGSIAFGGEFSDVGVGDGSVAKAASDSFAHGWLTSVAIVDDRGWALSSNEGVAVCRGGIAEVDNSGIACAYSREPGEGERGIAIAGPGGMAVAFSEGSLVQAGPGGALAGFWSDGSRKHLALQPIDARLGWSPDTLYRFEGGLFRSLTDAEAKQAAADIQAWKGKWPAR